MARDFRTRSGVDIDDTNLPFKVTTEMMQSYIQNRINSAVREANEKSGETGRKYQDAQLQIYTVESGKNFLPCLVILPSYVAEGEEKKKSSGINIFDGNDNDKSVDLKSPYFEVFKKYIFIKEDEGAFRSLEWRRRTKVSQKAAEEVRRLRKPIRITDHRSKKKVVTFMIDSIRVFYDMLYMEADREDYSIEIKKYKKLGTGKFNFSINRVKNKAKKNKNNRGRSIIDMINSRMKN